jgi:pimeloyl-ACP methyl ester carboxylesterase
VPAIVLADGRALAYEEFGDRGGAPVLLFHGAPGSRLFHPGDVAGVRLLTFDRPGYGGSTPHDDRTLRDTAADACALLDQLGIDACGVVGWSGGGPFAVATAHAYPARVTKLAIVSAPGPLDEVPGAWEALGPYQRPTAEMARREPHRSARAVGRHMQPYLVDPALFVGGEGVARGPGGGMLVAQVTEALRQGTGGMAADMIAMWLPWGFALAAVAVPTTVFHGALDPHNESDAKYYADAIPGASLTVWPDDGHLGVVAHWPEIVAAVA